MYDAIQHLGSYLTLASCSVFDLPANMLTANVKTWRHSFMGKGSVALGFSLYSLTSLMLSHSFEQVTFQIEPFTSMTHSVSILKKAENL